MDREQYVATFAADPAVTLTVARNCFHSVDEFYVKRETTMCPKCADIVRSVNGQIVAYHNRENGERCCVDYKRAVAAGAITREAALAEGWDGK